MKRTLALAMAGVMAAALATAADTKKAAPAAAPGVADQIKKMEADRAQAVVRADVATLEGMTADDYTFVNSMGHLSGKAETMSGIKSGTIKITTNEVSDLNVRLYGNTAIVTGKTDIQGTINGAAIKSPVMFTRVYVKKAGRWQSVALQQTPISAP